MGLYAQFDTGAQRDLSSNLGWSEFGDWAETLDAKQHTQVIHLWKFGWCQKLDVLQTQLKAAIKDKPPAKDVKSTVDLLLENLSARGAAEVLTVTDGIGKASTTEDAKAQLEALKQKRNKG